MLFLVPSSIPAINQTSFSTGDFVNISSGARQRPRKDSVPIVTGTDGAETEEPGEQDTQGLFCCPKDGCVKAFQRHSSLENHLLYGRCNVVVERKSLFDKAITMYRNKLSAGPELQPILTSSKEHTTSKSPPLLQGWALRSSKKTTRFNDHQKSYLDEKFKIGQVTGHKLDPHDVARDMRYAKTETGERRFQVEEFLTSQQVQSYFSRTSAKLKRGQEQYQDEIPELDQVAAEEEINYSTTKTSVMNSIQLTHPVVYDTYNLCHLVASGGLKKLSVSMLRSICDYFDIDVSNVPRSRKAPYIKLIRNNLVVT